MQLGNQADLKTAVLEIVPRRASLTPWGQNSELIDISKSAAGGLSLCGRPTVTDCFPTAPFWCLLRLTLAAL